MSFGGIPPTCGVDFTRSTYHKAEGSTDPANNSVDGKEFVVCVTGAGKGLGHHVALAYARAGVSGLVISSRTSSDLENLSAEIKKVGPRVEVLSQTCDTQKDEDVRRLAEATKQKFGRLDVCVSNAGVISKYLEDGSLPVGIDTDLDFERVMDINFFGTVRVARAFYPLLQESRGAQAFIVITSLAAHWVHSNLTPIAYNCSKRAVCHLVEQMHSDHGKDGLVAYAAHPGAVLTPQTQNHSLQKGDVWDTNLNDDVGLCGGFLTWLTKEKREYLSGRYLSVNWDVDELEKMKGDIVEKDLLKFKMGV